MGKAKTRSRAEEARFDRWVASLGGYNSERFRALRDEAVEFAGPAGCTDYLDMAMRFDEEHAALKRDRAARGLAVVRAEAARRAADAAVSTTGGAMRSGLPRTSCSQTLAWRRRRTSARSRR